MSQSPGADATPVDPNALDRETMVVAAVEIVMITLAVYGESGNFHLAS